MDDDKRLEIATAAMQGLLAGDDFTPVDRNGVAAKTYEEARRYIADIALDYADELIKQHALRIAEREKREHEK